MAGQAGGVSGKRSGEQRREGVRQGSFAKRTGQSSRKGLAAFVSVCGGVLLLIDGTSRSPWRAGLGVTTDVGTMCGLAGPFVVLAGLALRWWGVRCPQCHAPVYWRHVSSQALFRRDTSDPDRYGRVDCGYQPR